MIRRGNKRDIEQIEPAAPDMPDVGVKGFDDFELRLGDMMRGERATLGKSLLDVQRELRINAAYIAAIENADPSAFDTPGFIAGYVRSYARYLGMDPEWAFQTFCDESGFTTAHGMSSAASTLRSGREDVLAPAATGGSADPFAASKMPYQPMGERMFSGVEPGAVGSVLVLLALIGGLGYGGWTVLQEVQRVQLAPVEQPPTVVADIDPLAGGGAPVVEEEVIASIPEAPSAEALDRLYRPEALDVPRLIPRDGPIATLDPRSIGTFVPEPAPAFDDIARADPGGFVGPMPLPVDAVPDVAQDEAPRSVAQVTEDPIPNVIVVAAGPAWMRVRAADGTTLNEQTLQRGQSYVVPILERAPVLRTGNGGATYLIVGGEAFGPVGGTGEVVSNLALSPEAIRDGYQIADLEADAELREFLVALNLGAAVEAPAAE
ncbi:helix-turn-helix domain-containing protein [Aestuariibius sp. 2305UL40-4]|uniref:helix-turn-helix domain-containing protein n=1 Tax=Aestuariibius violaceus TaxID=3234132 RepID=UPI00345E8DF3